MKDIGKVSGMRLTESDRFSFQCSPELACFKRCCQNLNLYLYPYDALRLQHCLGISADAFLEAYVDLVLRPGNYFPDVLLRMSNDDLQTCIFSEAAGCRVYKDRPHTCRTFPVEYGLRYRGNGQPPELWGFFRPPEFCLGPNATIDWTLRTWVTDQEAVVYQEMSQKWSEVKSLFQNNPWGGEGVQGNRAKMAFMASYNMDAFRKFVFESSFLNRFRVDAGILEEIQADDVRLMLFGFDWIKLSVWGIHVPDIRPR